MLDLGHSSNVKYFEDRHCLGHSISMHGWIFKYIWICVHLDDALCGGQSPGSFLKAEGHMSKLLIIDIFRSLTPPRNFKFHMSSGMRNQLKYIENFVTW